MSRLPWILALLVAAALAVGVGVAACSDPGAPETGASAAAGDGAARRAGEVTGDLDDAALDRGKSANAEPARVTVEEAQSPKSPLNADHLLDQLRRQGEFEATGIVLGFSSNRRSIVIFVVEEATETLPGPGRARSFVLMGPRPDVKRGDVCRFRAIRRGDRAFLKEVDPPHDFVDLEALAASIPCSAVRPYVGARDHSVIMAKVVSSTDRSAPLGYLEGSVQYLELKIEKVWWTAKSLRPEEEMATINTPRILLRGGRAPRGTAFHETGVVLRPGQRVIVAIDHLVEASFLPVSAIHVVEIQLD